MPSASGRRERRLMTPPIAPAPQKRRRHTLDDLDLCQIHRRNLEQTEAADLAKQRWFVHCAFHL